MQSLPIINVTSLILASILSVFLAVTVYKNATNKIYALLGLTLVMWQTANFFSLIPQDVDYGLAWVRLSIGLAVLVSYLFFMLSCTIPSRTVSLSRSAFLLYTGLAVVSCIVALSPLTFTDATIVDGSITPTAGPGIALFLSTTTGFSIGAIVSLLKKLRNTTDSTRFRYRLMLMGIGTMLGLIICTVALPVVLIQESFFVAFIPLYTFVFLGFASLAIIRYQLFDIRFVIAKSAGYLLLLVLLAGLMGVVSFVVSQVFINDVMLYGSQQVLLVCMTIGTAFIFQPIRRLVDHVTERVFYKRPYEPQLFINDFNKALVSASSLEQLMTHSLSAINTNLKPSNCGIYLSATDYQADREFRLDGSHPPSQHISKIARYLRASEPRVVDAYTSPPAHIHRSLQSIMRKNRVEVVGGLQSTLNQHNADSGYVYLGPKLSGDPYTAQDLRMVGILANELILAVENALKYEEINAFNATLQKKIDTATRKLKNANAHLQELDQTKDDFISMTSHQLKPQLTAAMGFITMLEDGVEGELNPGQKELNALSLRGIDRMNEIVRDLLDLSKIKSGKVDITPKKSNLMTIATEEVTRLQPRAQSEKNIALALHAPKTYPNSMFDEVKMREVITNLISNAVQYSHPDSTITVDLSSTAQKLKLTVKDTGIGVPKKAQAHLFTKFFRADNAQTVRPAGTGVGLFFVKKMVEAHDGTMIFHSEEGSGSTFGFTIPKNLHKK